MLGVIEEVELKREEQDLRRFMGMLFGCVGIEKSKKMMMMMMMKGFKVQ